MVALRLDHRLNGRIDPSDVIQEAQLEAAERLAEYLRNPTMPFFFWLRQAASELKMPILLPTMAPAQARRRGRPKNLSSRGSSRRLFRLLLDEGSS